MAPTLSAEFKKAEIDINKCSDEPNQNDKLELYGLFKVARGEKPSGGWGIEARLKQNAYNKVKDMEPAKAQQEYVKLVEKLKPKYKYNPNNVPKK